MVEQMQQVAIREESELNDDQGHQHQNGTLEEFELKNQDDSYMQCWGEGWQVKNRNEEEVVDKNEKNRCLVVYLEIIIMIIIVKII